MLWEAELHLISVTVAVYTAPNSSCCSCCRTEDKHQSLITRLIRAAEHHTYIISADFTDELLRFAHGPRRRSKHRERLLVHLRDSHTCRRARAELHHTHTLSLSLTVTLTHALHYTLARTHTRVSRNCCGFFRYFVCVLLCWYLTTMHSCSLWYSSYSVCSVHISD